MARILVIDDDELLRKVIVTSLRMAGHIVSEANGGNQGLKLVASEPTDLILTDLVMPEKDGIETLLAVKQRYPGIVIVAMSGVSQHAPLYLKVAKQLGAHRILEKPFELATLLRLIEEALPTGAAE